MNNRDTWRNNKANKAVQAYLHGKITHDIVSTVMSNHTSSDQSEGNEDATDKLLHLVLQSDNKMTNYFGESQSDLNKLICAKYANDQHSKISRAISNNEEWMVYPPMLHQMNYSLYIRSIIVF